MPSPQPPADSLSSAFVAVLQSERQQLNQRFAAQSHLAGGLDGDAFLQHLAGVLDPLVAGVAALLPERARSVTTELFDLSLELFSAGCLGPNAIDSTVSAVWTEILPQIPRLMWRQATAVAGSLTNAAFNVARQEGADHEFWLREMTFLSPQCESVSQLTDCGALVAWRAGMVQYRSTAMEKARGMERPLALAALGLAAETSADQLEQTLNHVADSPWLSLESPPSTVASVLKLVRAVGQFRGFGGVFVRPPAVVYQNGAIVASDGHHGWQVLADCYGSLLHRVGPAVHIENDNLNTVPASNSGEVHVDQDGNVFWRGIRGTFAELHGANTFATDGQTLAVTVDDSHHVFLLAAL